MIGAPPGRKNLASADVSACLRELQGLAYNACLLVLRHRQEAEDACQEALLSFVRNADMRWEKQAMRRWLYRVSINAALKKRRASLTRKNREQAAAEQQLREANNRQLVERVLEKMVLLDDEQRCVLLEHYLEQRTMREMASERGCSAGTIWKRIEQGKERLRVLLKRGGLGALAAAGLEGCFSSLVPVPAPPTLLSPSFLEKANKAASKAGTGALGGVVLWKLFAGAAVLVAGSVALIFMAAHREQPGAGPGVPSSSTPEVFSTIAESQREATPDLKTVELAGETGSQETHTTEGAKVLYSFDVPKGVGNIESMAFDGTGLWVRSRIARSGRDLYRLSSIDGTVMAELDVGKARARPRMLEWDGARLWTYNEVKREFTAVDPRSGDVLHSISLNLLLPRAIFVRTLAFGDGFFWIAHHSGRKLLMLNPDTGEVVNRESPELMPFFKRGGGPMAFSNRGLWFPENKWFGAPVVKIDVDSKEMRNRIPCPMPLGRVAAMCAGEAGRLWMYCRGEGEEERIYLVEPGGDWAVAKKKYR